MCCFLVGFLQPHNFSHTRGVQPPPVKNPDVETLDVAGPGFLRDPKWFFRSMGFHWLRMKSSECLGSPGLPKDTLTFTLGVNRPRLAAAARGERRAEAWAAADATVEGPTPDPTSPMETPCGLCGQLKEPEVESRSNGGLSSSKRVCTIWKC